MLDDFGEILTLSEVSNILRIGLTNTYKLVRTGELKAFKTGKSWRITKQELVNYIRGRSDK